MLDPTIRRIESTLRNPWVLLSAGAVLLAILLAVLVATFPLYRPVLESQFSFSLLVMAVMLFVILNGTALCILAERKVAAFTQDRFGPNRVGFWGLLQPIADGLKFLLKEDIIPARVDRPLYLLAPTLSLVVSLLGFAIIPWAGYVRWPWLPADAPPLTTQVANLNVGFLYLVAVGAVGVYGVVLAGYASNNKYAFYGGMRAAAQMMSYELPLGLALLVLLLTTGTLRLDEIVRQQAATGTWYVFAHPLAFFLVLVTAFAETNRAPFDLPEAEQELVGGYHTEYSAMKFAMFFLAEYAHMITNSALIVALFFGGWAPLPFVSWYSETSGVIDPTWWNVSWGAMLLKLAIYLTKVALFIGLYMLIRWTIPRFRFDQLLRIAWQGLVPAGIGLLTVTALLAYAGWHRNAAVTLVANVLILLVCLRAAARSRRPVTARQEDLPPIDVAPPITGQHP